MEVSTEVRQAAKEYANAISEQKGFILGGINWANFVDAFIAGASYSKKIEDEKQSIKK